MISTSARTGILFAICLIAFILPSTVAEGAETIAFVRNGDLWLMNTDGTNQRPFLAGKSNARGRVSWEPGNNRLIFARDGQLQLKYPDGGGGQHKVYDIFFAFLDSTNNFWEGATDLLGARDPEWSQDGSKIVFTYDKNAVYANATWPDFQIGVYDVASLNVTVVEMPRGDDPFLASSPTMSPDGSKIACTLTKFEGKGVRPLGLVVVDAAGVTQTATQLEAIARNNSDATAPSWSPDGQWIAFLSSDLTSQGLFIIRPDLTGRKQIFKAPINTMVYGTPSWSPDGKKIVFATGNKAINTINVDGTGHQVISGPGSDEYPSWSK